MNDTERIEINNIAVSIMEDSLYPKELFEVAKRIYDLTKDPRPEWTPCAEGRIEIKEKDNKHDVRVCSNCQSIVHYDPYFKRYFCRTCGQESYLPQAAKEMMEAARALDEPKGEATT